MIKTPFNWHNRYLLLVLHKILNFTLYGGHPSEILSMYIPISTVSSSKLLMNPKKFGSTSIFKLGEKQGPSLSRRYTAINIGVGLFIHLIP